MYGKVKSVSREVFETAVIAVPCFCLTIYTGWAWQEGDMVGGFIGLILVILLGLMLHRACQYLAWAQEKAGIERQLNELHLELGQSLLQLRIADGRFHDDPTEENGRALDEAQDKHYMISKKLDAFVSGRTVSK